MVDYILAREICPNCLSPRVLPCGQPPKLNSDGSRVVPISDIPVDSISGQKLCPNDYCFSCGAVFRELVNTEVVPTEYMDILVKRCFKYSEHFGVAGVEKTKELLAECRKSDGKNILPSDLRKDGQSREPLMIEL